MCYDCDYKGNDETELKRHMRSHKQKVTNEELKEDIKAAKEEVLQSLKIVLKGKEAIETDKNDKDDSTNLLIKARSINDVLVSFPEFFVLLLSVRF